MRMGPGYRSSYSDLATGWTVEKL